VGRKCGSGLGTVSIKETGRGRGKKGREGPCHDNACRDCHFCMHGNLGEIAPLKSSREAVQRILKMEPQSSSCPGKELWDL
jgi:hypothetical protein